MSSELPDPRTAAHGYARDLVRTGFEPAAEIVRSVCECMEEYELEGLETLVGSCVEAEIRSLQDEQQGWSHPTDCERLDQVFADLKSMGIMAQHHYTCCGTCGNFEIGLHLRYESSMGRAWRGYAFYHVQDTESAIHGYGQYLSYGAADQEDDEASVGIGQEIVGVLRTHGFEPRWDGTIGKRIAFDMAWQQPWPPRTPDVVPQGALDLYQTSLNEPEKQQSKRKPGGFIARVAGRIRRRAGS